MSLIATGQFCRVLTRRIVEKPVKKIPGWVSKVKTTKKAPVDLSVPPRKSWGWTSS